MNKLFIIFLTVLTPLCTWEGSNTLIIDESTRLQFDSFEIELKLRSALLELCENAQIEENQGVFWVNTVMYQTLGPLFNVKKSDIRTLYKDLLDQCTRRPVPNGCGDLWQKEIIATIIALAESSDEDLGMKRLKKNRIKRQNKKRNKENCKLESSLFSPPPPPRRSRLVSVPSDVFFGNDSGDETDSL
ncbi:MAG: hypothetical protein ACJAZS_000278 [Alteromonas naphthalenivorans]|jgi:hypothetical protein